MQRTWKLDAVVAMVVPLDPTTVLVHRGDAKTPSMKRPIYFGDLGWALAKGYKLHSCVPDMYYELQKQLIEEYKEKTHNWQYTPRR